MKKNFLMLAFLAFSSGIFAQSKTKTFDDKARAYIKEYGAWAIEEQLRVGIPASITLAQGIYETGAGESELATQANNHFGIKCKKEWQGATFAHTDDAPNECFRKYPSAKDSYKDHSDYLKNSARYADLFMLEKADYSGWAKGLKKCGYATNPAYAAKLIKMVEDYDLQMYTFAAEGKRQNEIVPGQEQPLVANIPPPISITEASDKAEEAVMGSSDGSVRINDIRAFYAKKGETLLDKAMKYNLRYARLLEINELADEPLKRDMYIYLEPKKSKGAHPTYIVKEGETIEVIAHNEGMNSRQLRIYNLLAQNEQPDAGSVLKLQEQADERPGTYKMKKEEVIANPAQNIKLINPNAPVQKDDFLPTKKSNQKVEEIEMGYGAAPPPELLAQDAAEKAKQQAIEKEKTVQPISIAQQPKIVAKQTREVKEANPAVPVSNRAALQEAAPETQLAPPIRQNEPSDLPMTLDPEGPQDELAILKAKLDKAVYARSSKSNVKISSDDSAAVFATKSATSSTASVKNNTLQNELKISNSDAAFHTVQKGETGYSIAKKYGIKVKDLNEMNGLNFEGIKVGQKLRVK